MQVRFSLSSFRLLRFGGHIYRRNMATRTYQQAIECLNSLQSNAAHLEAVRAAGNRKMELAIAEMVAYLEKIGYTVSLRNIHFPLLSHASEQQEDLNQLNVIHVTGTKGKGSTCAFTDSVLRALRPSCKVGRCLDLGSSVYVK
jgi:folylpolyglutamate synthase